MLQVYKTWLFLYDLTYLSLVWPSFDRNTCLALVVCTSVGIVKQHGFRSHFLCLQRMLHSLVSNQWQMICWMKMKLPWYDGWHCPGINACHWVFRVFVNKEILDESWLIVLDWNWEVSICDREGLLIVWIVCTLLVIYWNDDPICLFVFKRSSNSASQDVCGL